MAKRMKYKEQAPREPMPPRRCEFVLNRTIALGAGDRPLGTVMFTAERQGKKFNPATVEKADGVSEYELEQVKINQQLVEPV